MRTHSAADGSQAVLYGVHDRVAHVTLNRPEVSNAIDIPLARQLKVAMRSAGEDTDVDAVLLMGAGKNFCAGGDVAAMAAAADRPAFLTSLVRAAHEAVKVMDAMPKPVVAAVQGAAAGAGFALALGADAVVAGGSARFVTAYTSIGLSPDSGLSWLLPRAIGQQRALELIMMSAPVDAERARELGIVSQVCDDELVGESAHRLAVRLASRPTRALGEARHLVRSSWADGLETHLDREAEVISRLSAGAEAANLIAQFLDGSRPFA
ncbi:enoyl-CoA hydratase/isomerase family protein [Streptomyces spinoverrucosus]|uniref:enoyl-CoA hydratase/isomerase family protein n=1 Tax=Streptomyces spinoverrucosus TaxID=284043 RepID=UPI0018C38695|nr:enoyl-CoA hydratase-related protein [Streptomyces spinoverrucosus]MBG0855804.1 enoyl-CoA hydratase/isomerase family protein [Streptomyces spinoverrucosus]